MIQIQTAGLIKQDLNLPTYLPTLGHPRRQGQNIITAVIG